MQVNNLCLEQPARVNTGYRKNKLVDIKLILLTLSQFTYIFFYRFKLNAYKKTTK